MGPYRHTCWDMDNKVVRMRSYDSPVSHGIDYVCDYCLLPPNSTHFESLGGGPSH